MADPDQRSIFTDPNLRRIVAMVRAHPRPLAVALIALAISALTDPAIAKLTQILLDRGFYDRQDNAFLWVPLAFLPRLALLSRLAFSMEHPVRDFHDELGYRDEKSPTSAGGRALRLRLKA